MTRIETLIGALEAVLSDHVGVEGLDEQEVERLDEYFSQVIEDYDAELGTILYDE